VIGGRRSEDSRYISLFIIYTILFVLCPPALTADFRFPTSDSRPPMSQDELVEIYQTLKDQPPETQIQRYTQIIDKEALPAGSLALVLCNRGLAYARLMDNDHAMEDLGQAIQMNPYLADAYAGRAEIWVGRKEYNKALRDLNQAASLTDNPMYEAARGFVLIQLGRFKKAGEVLNAALKMTPDNPRLLLVRSMLHDASGEQYKARVDERELQAQSEHWSGVYKEVKEMMQAPLPEEQGVPKPKALTAAEMDALFEQARRQFNENRYADSLILLNRLLENDPERMRALLYRARTLSATGKHSAALLDLNVLLEKAPDQKQLYLLRAKANYGASHYQEAISDYESVLQFDPHSAEAREGLLRIKRETGTQGRKR